MKKYKLLAVVVVLIYFFQSFFLYYGGIGADSLSYFGIASDFPELKTNLFPPVYPFLLRLFYSVFNDYFWAYKIINLLMLIFILLFSWFKKFYFKETLLLFTGKSLFFAMTGALSESPFIFVFYFLLYFVHQFLSDKINSKKFVIVAALLMVLMMGIRYSGVYVFLGLILFGFYGCRYLWDRNKSLVFFSFILVSGFGITCFLVFNYFIFGSFTGEHLRGEPAKIQLIYLVRDLLGMSNVVDPFIGIKPASNSFASMAFQVVLMFCDLFLVYKFVHWYKKNQSGIKGSFHILLWVLAGVYTVFLFLSGLVQQIEEMNVRMLAVANVCVFFSMLILYFQVSTNDKWLFAISVFFLGFLTVYSLKDIDYFLSHKRKLEPQVAQFQDKEYLFNDERNIETYTLYKFPFINKTLKYKHTNKQIGELKQTIIGTVNPRIKWLKYDTVQDKSKVLYTSKLRLKN